jgi:ammonium transporter, Amt family
MPEVGTVVDLGSLNYTVLMPYNGTVPTGGDSLVQDLNVFYQVII